MSSDVAMVYGAPFEPQHEPWKGLAAKLKQIRANRKRRLAMKYNHELKEVAPNS